MFDSLFLNFLRNSNLLSIIFYRFIFSYFKQNKSHTEEEKTVVSSPWTDYKFFILPQEEKINNDLQKVFNVFLTFLLIIKYIFFVKHLYFICNKIPHNLNVNMIVKKNVGIRLHNNAFVADFIYFIFFYFGSIRYVILI